MNSYLYLILFDNIGKYNNDSFHNNIILNIINPIENILDNSILIFYKSLC